jgi:hypothetical protein
VVWVWQGKLHPGLHDSVLALVRVRRYNREHLPSYSEDYLLEQRYVQDKGRLRVLNLHPRQRLQRGVSHVL